MRHKANNKNFQRAKIKQIMLSTRVKFNKKPIQKNNQRMSKCLEIKQYVPKQSIGQRSNQNNRKYFKLKAKENF